MQNAEKSAPGVLPESCQSRSQHMMRFSNGRSKPSASMNRPQFTLIHLDRQDAYMHQGLDSKPSSEDCIKSPSRPIGYRSSEVYREGNRQCQDQFDTRRMHLSCAPLTSVSEFCLLRSRFQLSPLSHRKSSFLRQ